MLRLKEVSTMTQPQTPVRARAVVLGGGIAGLLSARVLADAYDHVTIVERDLLPAGAEQRRGIPQGEHVHGLLPRGRQIVEGLLPGFTDQLVEAGGLPGDILGNVRWYLNGRLLRQADTGLAAISASRPLIESVLRARVAALPNVALLDGHDIVGLRPSASRQRITGVRVTSPHTETSRVLPANLVVDATGRASRTPRWLFELGFPTPPEDRVGIDLAYVSRRFTAPPEIFGDDVVVVTARFPGQRRSSVMQRLEDGSVLVTLAGVVGERPPVDLAGGLAYAQTLAAPVTHEVLRYGTPVGAPIGFRLPRYVRRHYESLPSFPAGLLVIGDSACNFNPIYGQGMTVAALSVDALAHELAHGGEPDPTRYHAAAAQVLAPAWGLSVGPDLAIEGVTGPALPPSPLTGEYLQQLQLAATEDATLAEAFLRVTALIDPPPALLRPEITARVQQLRTALIA
jgi:2-polyprenyl-6-methoxyphenol hydroxylase-like FAD-dependent oxidoreductase